MRPDPLDSPDRRTFLRTTGAVAAAAAVSLPASGVSAQEAKAAPEALPRRPLGKTGYDVTILNQGGIRGPALDRVLRTSYANGVRMFDAAKVYGSEPNFKRWFEQAPEVRKEIFLVTKDMPTNAGQMMGMVDERLETCGTDYIDLFFLHGLGDAKGADDAINLVTSKEFREAADAIRKSGKARLIGFSTHHKDRAAIIQAAADAGTVDAIMLMYNPWVATETALNKALDTCWKKGVGLISMKQIAGKFFGDRSGGNNLEKIVQQVPTLKEKGLSPYQGLLHAIWTDERISAVCTSMRNLEQIRENTDAARRFEPLKVAEVEQLRNAVIACGATLCADCDGRCSVAAGTTAELGNLTRFLTYHEHHGHRAEARREYAKLSPEARDWHGADLDAAREACPNRLDFARLLPRVDERLA